MKQEKKKKKKRNRYNKKSDCQSVLYENGNTIKYTYA